MNSVKEWSSLICITSVICTISEFLIPPGKIEKTMDTILGIFVLCAVIMPFSRNINLLKIKSPEIETVKNINKKTDAIFKKSNEQIIKATEENLKIIISKTLSCMGVHAKKIEIFMDINKDNCILINKCRIQIGSNQESLKAQIQNTVENKLNIKTEVVIND